MAYDCYKANKDPQTGMYKTREYKSSIEPYYKMKVFERKNNVDALKTQDRKFQSTLRDFKPTTYKPKPYEPLKSVREYKLPDIDPLTGRPRRHIPKPQKPETKPEVVHTEEPEFKRKKRNIKPVIITEIKNSKLESRESKSDSRESKLDLKNSKLESRESKSDSRESKLDLKNSNGDSKPEQDNIEEPYTNEIVRQRRNLKKVAVNEYIKMMEIRKEKEQKRPHRDTLIF